MIIALLLLGQLCTCPCDASVPRPDATSSLLDATVPLDAGTLPAGCGRTLAPRYTPRTVFAFEGDRRAYSRSLTVGGVTRSYVLSVDADYDATNSVPRRVGLGLHGASWTGASFRAQTWSSPQDWAAPEVEQASITAGVSDSWVFVYPDARSGGTPCPGTTSWAQSTEDTAFLAAVVADVRTNLCVTGPIAVYGRSCGAGAALWYACGAPADVSSVSILSGAVLNVPGSGTWSGCNTPVLWIHGTADTVVSFSQAESRVQSLRTAYGCASESVVTPPSLNAGCRTWTCPSPRGVTFCAATSMTHTPTNDRFGPQIFGFMQQ